MNRSKKLSWYSSFVANGSTVSAAGPLGRGEADDLARPGPRAREMERTGPVALPEPEIRPDECSSIGVYSADAKRP